MEYVGLVFAALAALVHVYIFYIESVAFTTTGRKIFGVPADEAEVARPWAYNQGFYNLFLALGTGFGVGLALADRAGGLAWVTFGLLCMVGAALVLALSDRSKLRSAAIQGAFPLLGLVGLALSRL